MANDKVNRFDPPTHTLVEVVNPQVGQILSVNGTSNGLNRMTRVVSDRVVFVDNIADTVAQEQFVDLIKEFALRGAILDVKFKTRNKGGSFCFIEFEHEEDGRQAIAHLNRTEFKTSYGKTMELRASKAENTEEAVSNKNLYVKGIPTHWNHENLKERFRNYGSISHCRVLRAPGNDSENTGVGFVHFYNGADAQKSVHQVNGQLVDPQDPGSNILQVRFARAKKPRKQQRRRKNNKRGGRDMYHSANNNYDQAVPNWNFGRGRMGSGRGPSGGGRGIRGGRNQGGWSNNNPMYPPNEEMWQKMVELMQNMGQNPYQQMYSGQNYQQQYNYGNQSFS